jgi:hypothetical protein
MTESTLATAIQLLRWGDCDLAPEERLRWKQQVARFLRVLDDAALRDSRPPASAIDKAWPNAKA